MKRRFGGRTMLGIALTVLLVGAACSTDNKDTQAADTTTTTTRPPLPDYSKAGPFEAGSMNAALPDGRRVAIWYPADPSAAKDPKETFDIASLLSPALQAKVPAALRRKIAYPVDAHPGALPARGGPFPLVLFSHGFAGFPEQSVNLTTHLARWGFVVVAPDHVERSLDGLLGTAATGIKKLTDPVVLGQSIDLAVTENRRADSPLLHLVNTKEVAVIGHSAGAEAAYDTASLDHRIKSFISYSVSLGGPEGAPAPPPPKVPGMVMVGTKDGVIPLADNRKVYRGMRSPKYFATFADAGHNVFSDICEFGRSEGGLTKLVKQIGLDIPASLLKLANDGCKATNLDPRKAFPAINLLSVAFLRSTLGLGESPDLQRFFTKASPVAPELVTARVELQQVP